MSSEAPPGPIASSSSSGTGLCPGYRHVESFDEVEDGVEFEEEEEVMYVTLDMGDLHPTLLPNCSGYRLAGLDTEHPFIQLNDTIFMGEHHTLLGTEILFEESRDEGDASKKFVKPLGLTSKRIHFKEVEVHLPEEGGQETSSLGMAGNRNGGEIGMKNGLGVLKGKGKRKSLRQITSEEIMPSGSGAGLKRKRSRKKRLPAADPGPEPGGDEERYPDPNMEIDPPES